jgi:hypothetical protein
MAAFTSEAPALDDGGHQVVSSGATVVVIARSPFSMSVAVGAAAQGVCAWAATAGDHISL